MNYVQTFIKSLSLITDIPDQKTSADQSTAATWWQQHLGNPHETPRNVFSATHGLVQTHPALSGGIARPSVGPSITASTSRPLTGGPSPSRSSVSSGFPAAVNPNPRSPFRHLDFSTSATAELRRNPSLSAPDECARACREGEPPRICYYHFTLEYYTVLGA